MKITQIISENSDWERKSKESEFQPGVPVRVWYGPPTSPSGAISPAKSDKKYWKDGVVADSPEWIDGRWELLVDVEGKGNQRFSIKRVFKQSDVEEGKKHTSPSGAKTNMKPGDDDYDINYGKNGLVAKFRKSQGLDVKTGKKKVKEDQTAGEIRRLIDQNKKMIGFAKQQKWGSVVKDLESAIEKLEAKLKLAPETDSMPKSKTPQMALPRGYSYEPYEEDEGDVRKIYHNLKTPDGKTINIPFSPYDEMTDSDVALWIELGMPRRKGGNWDSQDLQKLARQKGL